MKIRWLIVGIFVAIALLTFAMTSFSPQEDSVSQENSNEDSIDADAVGFSPVTCSDPSQVLFRLSNESNAHAEVWNGSGNYGYEVCYDEIFGSHGSGDRVCSGLNTLVRLSSNTNAHLGAGFIAVGEGLQPGSNYPISICYEGLTCRTTQQACGSGEELIVRLSAYDNAHAQHINFAGSNYGYNVCCSVSTSPGNETEPPAATGPGITSPVDLGIYFVDTTINFTANGTNLEWTILKKQGQNLVTEFTSTNASFKHTFSTSGQRVIRLKDNSKPSLNNSQQISIVIVGVNEVLADIAQPEAFSVVPKQGNSFVVNFDAKTSYVVNVTAVSGAVSACLVEMRCLAGNCPAQPQNTPNATAGICTPSMIPISGSPALTGLAPNYSDMQFKWTFDDGNVVTINGKTNGSKFYGAGSNALNDKKIDLIVNYTKLNQIFGVTSNSFTLGQCINNGNSVIVGNEIKPTTGAASAGNCAALGIGSMCCPAGHACVGDVAGQETCQPTGIEKCSDYTTKNACDDDTSNVVEADPLYDEDKCGKTIDGITYVCQCKWSGSESGESCAFSITGVNNNPSSTGSSGDDEPCVENSCSYTYTTGQCTNGFMQISVNSANGETESGVNYCNLGGNTCSTSDISVPSQVACGKLTFQLSFFDYKQFIAVLIVVFGIYAFLHVGKKKE